VIPSPRMADTPSLRTVGSKDPGALPAHPLNEGPGVICLPHVVQIVVGLR
jgi:hypothetical protein